MAWYVFALTDERPRPTPGLGLSGALAVRGVSGGFAIVERSADVPPAEFGTLRTHEAVVARLAQGVPAILPVRFGTLLELSELEQALADGEQEIAAAFDRVRGRAQFTWRRRAARRGTKHAASGWRRAESSLSGTGYLRQAARESTTPLPAAFKPIREKLRRLVAAERFQPETPTLPDSLYHLVDRTDLGGCRLVAGKLESAGPMLRVTGPFAPFAFTPDLL
jgi:hypothetical protein